MESLVAIVVLLVVALAAMKVWSRAKRARYGFDPSKPSAEKRGLPEDRPTTWDPRERYE